MYFSFYNLLFWWLMLYILNAFYFFYYTFIFIVHYFDISDIYRKNIVDIKDFIYFNLCSLQLIFDVMNHAWNFIDLIWCNNFFFFFFDFVAAFIIFCFIPFDDQHHVWSYNKFNSKDIKGDNVFFVLFSILIYLSNILKIFQELLII